MTEKYAHVAPLCEHAEHIETVARWVVDQWANSTVEECKAGFLQTERCPGAVIAIIDTQPVGVIAFSRYRLREDGPEDLWVNVLYVDKPWRGRGVGSELLRAGVERARQTQPGALFVYTDVPRFYEAHGWKQIRHNVNTGMFVLEHSANDHLAPSACTMTRPTPHHEIVIRPWQPTDDVEHITALLHRAYAQLAQLGFRYHATWQDAATTLDRLTRGIPYVAVRDGSIVGTITLYVPPNVSGCAWYDRGDVAIFGQFGVDPDLQRLGIGSRLLDAVEAEATARRIKHLALDTAEGATHLIELYRKRGFAHVGYADWDVTNYRSVIMNKALQAQTEVSE